MCRFYPRDMAKLMYALGLANKLSRDLLRAIEPKIEANMDRFTKIVRFPGLL